ncbi:unnamed protein product [Adineta ricciae]|uniref:ZZ-type domain-containing protein n=1 Tax=Adineta ricciae TaxID=249248 RepID=A0A816EQ68_ADIRI|nr:unnamed protein product [Adineta ricciae]
MSRQSNIYCNGCSTSDFINARYKCQVCSNYNLCTACYDSKIQSFGHLSSHTMLRIELPSTANPEPITKQYSDQMNRLEDSYLSRYMSNLAMNQPKRTLETLDQLSVDRLYEYLTRLDPNLRTVAEKLQAERVSGADLISFDENDYKSFDVTYGDKKKLQLLIERKQAGVSNVSDLSQIQSEITQLKLVIKSQEEEIAEKNNSIQQLEDILSKQEQQTQLQDAIIQQLQEALEKQKQEMDMLMEVVEQQRTLIASTQKP